jgi:diguanylate cyclase (GGDEF)-like protein/PAS domain S-box-containing protein
VDPAWPLWLALAVLTATGLCALGATVWRGRATEGGLSFVVLLGGAALWVLCSGLEHGFADLEMRARFARLAWLGIVLVPPATLVVALQATGRERLVRPSLLALLAAPALAILALVATDGHHHGIWRSASIELDGGVADLHVVHGPVFWVSVAYHYALLGVASVLLAARYLREWSRNRTEALLVGTAIGAPWLANVIYLTNEAQPSLDLTPYAFSVTAACLSLALWRGNGLLNVIRIARSQILDEMSDGALVVDARNRLIYANRAARTALGLDEVVTPLAATLALEGHPDLLHALQHDPPDGREHEISIHHARGDWRTYDLRVTTLEDFRGIATSRVLALRDVSESRRAQAALRDSEVLLRQIIDLLPHIIFAKDRQGRYILVNRTMAETTGRTTGEMLGAAPRSPGPRDDAQYERMLAEDRLVIDTGRPRFHPEVRWRYGNGELRTYQVSKIPFNDPGTGDPSMLGIAIDVTERKATEERMRALAYYDTLTGLPNRQRFRTLLERALEAAGRRQRRAALLFLDLDRFKQVNDRLGHAQGDALLRTIAERLGDCIRFSDQIVAPRSEERQSTVSRLGGDEFTILLADIDDPLDAAVVARRILDALSGPIEVDGQEVYTSASVGIAIYPDDASDAAMLFRQADQAMYAAKRRGRGRHAFFTPAMTEASERRAIIEQGLRHAVEHGELSIHYQPARHARSGLLVGAEALLRWKHPTLGPVSPAELLPVCEDTGMIVPIGEWVLATVCEQIRVWRVDGLAPVPISVNVSGFQIQQGGLLGFVADALEDSGTSPGLLELEITESTLMSDDEQTRETLRALKAMGVAFALDDFGTGYSSLSYLRRFPFDAVKIDRSFVQDVVSDPGGLILTQSIIDMAHGLGLRVVAEGVETFEELECLREAGCDVVQGHLLSSPLPVEEFTRYLQHEKEHPAAGA